MLLLQNKHIQPHLALKLLSLDNTLTAQQKNLTRIGYLLKTRLLDELLEAVESTKQLKISHEQIQKARFTSHWEADALKTELNRLDAESRTTEDENEVLDAAQMKMYYYSKVLYDEGKYKESLDLIIALEGQMLGDQLWLKTTWAKVHCEIMLDLHTPTINSLKLKLDSLHQEQKHQRILFKTSYARKEMFLILATIVYFKHPTEENLTKYVQLCTSDKSYFSILQLTCPQIFRYVCAAVLLTKSLHNNRAFDIFKVTEVINRKIITYSDAITDFIQALYINFDFQDIENRIKQLSIMVNNDGLLRPLQNKLVQCASFLYYKVKCRIFQTISLTDVAVFTKKSIQEAELWLLRYMRNGEMEAKIDQINQTIVANLAVISSTQKYAAVISKAGGLVNELAATLEL